MAFQKLLIPKITLLWHVTLECNFLCVLAFWEPSSPLDKKLMAVQRSAAVFICIYCTKNFIISCLPAMFLNREMQVLFVTT